MSNHEDYNTLKPEIDAIEQRDILYPTMPMANYLQEAEDLYNWVQQDKEAFEAALFDWALVEKLPALAGAARHAQSQWNSSRFTKEEAQKEYNRRSPDAYDLRDTIVHHMLFAYRKHPDVLERVRAIAEGSGDADMIQDLSDLSVHGKNHPDPLAAIGFDANMLDQAANLSDELASLLAVAHGEAASDKGVKTNRDKSYTLLKRAVDEIREYGRYIFWRDEDRRFGYASAYKRRTRSARPAAVSEPELPGTPQELTL